MDYKKKYLKYKTKYITLKKNTHISKQMIIGGNSDLEFETMQKNIIMNKLMNFCQKENGTKCILTLDEVKIFNDQDWNWIKIKKTFGNNYDVMSKYFNLRKNIIDDLIDNVFRYFECTELKCQKNYSGSVGSDANLLSDYDLTIVNQNLKTSKIIQVFNSIIFDVFKCTPAEAFDTNLYGYSCIIPNTSFFKNTKTWKPIPFDIGKYYLPQDELNIEQDKWAIRRLLVSMGGENINVSVANSEILEWFKNPQNDVNNLDMTKRAKNYIDKMSEFEKTLFEYNDENYNEQTETLKSVRDKMINNLSYMNFYGDETYFTTGSFMHVVGTMFYYSQYDDMDKIKILTYQQLVHSMIENLAYFIHTMNQKNKNVIIGSKYLERFFNGYKLFLIKKNISPSINLMELINLLNFIKKHYRNRTDEEIINFEKNRSNHYALNNNTDVSELKLGKIDDLDKLMLSLYQDDSKLFSLYESNKYHFYIYELFALIKSCASNIHTNIQINNSDENNIIVELIYL